jgi:hypothetical protein
LLEIFFDVKKASLKGKKNPATHRKQKSDNGQQPQITKQAFTKEGGPSQKFKGPQQQDLKDQPAKAWGAPLALRGTHEPSHDG